MKRNLQYLLLTSLFMFHLGIIKLQATSTTVTTDSSFITTWKTDNPGISNSSSIHIPVDSDLIYHYDIDWNNDGVFDMLGITDSITYDFGTPGIYTIRIRGSYPNIYFNNAGDKQKIIDIAQWGNIQWGNMHGAFHGCSNLNISATDVPDLSNVKNFTQIFAGCTAFNSNINHWDVSNVESFYFAFNNCINFNQPLDNWDMSSAKNLQRMFIGCNSFNQALNNWDVSNVTSFGAMFHNCINFNQALDNWDMSNAIHISLMFSNAQSFNQDIGSWQTSNVKTMHGIFNTALVFNQDISSWDVSGVSVFKLVFANAKAFNQNINNWDVSNATDMEKMFAGASNFNTPLDQWDVSNVTKMAYLFSRANKFNQDITEWDVGNVVGMEGMFNGPNMVFNQDIGHWDVSSATDMDVMFESNPVFDQDLSDWNVSNVSTMVRMFNKAKLSTHHYDSLLIGWNTLELQDSVVFHGGFSKYCQGWEARAHMINERGWVITDAGSEYDTPIALCKDTTLYLPSSGILTIDSSFINAGSYDFCTDIYLSLSQFSFDCDDIGTVSDTLFVTNMEGNQSICIANITIKDAPYVLNCPTDITVNVNTNNCQAQVNWEEPILFCTTNINSNYNTGDIFPLGTTIVSYTSIDDESNISTCSFNVSVFNNLTLQIDHTVNPGCLDDPSGQASISVSGGTPPYTYQWENSGGNTPSNVEDPTDLFAGMNRVTITDYFGCTIIDSVELQPTSLTIVDCPTNQIVPANYPNCTAIVYWTEPREICSDVPLSTTFISGSVFELGTTTVTYTAVNALGAMANCIFEITVENNLEVVPDQILNPNCFNSSDGQVSIFPNGGTNPYFFDWNFDGIGDFDDTQNIDNLPGGNYAVHIIDANDCQAYLSVQLSEPDKIELQIENVSDPSCANAQDGTSSISLSGGTGSFSIDWSHDGTGDWDDTELLNNLSDGTYTIEVIDEAGCSVLDSIILQQPEALVINVSIDTLNTNDETYIDINIYGGTSPYQFDWNNDGTGDYDDSEDITVHTSGIYSINVLDDHACFASLDIPIDLFQEDCNQHYFNLYPNPNYGIFTLELEACEEPTLIEIFDAVGRKVYVKETSEVIHLIELKNLSGDAYFLRVSNKKDSFIKGFSLVKD